MISYLIRKYAAVLVSLTVLLSFFPIFFGQPLARVIPSSIFWGGLFAAIYTLRRFLSLNLWALYDNLRLSRWWLLGALACVSILLSRVLSRIL